jgi:hypothetical protein
MGTLINADKQNSNLIQSIDWSKRSVEEWLEQYGLWVNDCKDKTGCISSDSAMAAWTSNESDRRRRDHRMNQFALNISDNEAKAVMRLLIDLKHYDQQLGAIMVMRYEQRLSHAVIAARSMGGISKTGIFNRCRAGLDYLHERMGLAPLNA